ncbi:MAG: hypothetical protein HC793_00500 [Aquincola sp.]|nr:hypothetical protein [Aquincola sp.]
MSFETYAGMCFNEPEEGAIESRIETLETALGRRHKGPMVYEFDWADVNLTH